MAERQDERYNIRVLDRALRILSLLSDGKARTLTELSEDVSLNSTTTFRLLASLAARHYVERDGRTGRYKLGLACLELARAYHEGNDIRRAALPELEKLRDETAETVHLGILNEMAVVYLEKLHGLHAIGLMSSQVGGRLPAYCTGIGKVMLAYVDPETVRGHYLQRGLTGYTDTTIVDLDDLMEHLQQVRRQGFAFDQGEREAEVRCVAAPVFDFSGKVVAAISVSGPASRMEPLEANRELVERTLEAARAISSRLGYLPPSSGSERERHAVARKG